MEQNTAQADPPDPTTKTDRPFPDGAATDAADRRWRRPTSERLIAGVATAFATHTGLPVWLVRLGFVVGALAGGFGVAAYLGMWALLPSEGEAQSATDRWRQRFAAAETASERAGLVLIGVAAVIAVAATGVLAAPVTVATLLVITGFALLRPVTMH